MMRRFLLRHVSGRCGAGPTRPAGVMAVRCMASRVRNHYEVLGVERDASTVDIKKAFYALSKKYHPDVVGADDRTAANKFLEAKEAYDVLRDDTKRGDYDLQLDGYGYGSAASSSSSSPASDQAYYRHVRRPPSNGSSYSQEDFHRIWRSMQSNAEFKRATRDIDEFLRMARERAYDDHMRRREKRQSEYSEEQMSKRPYRNPFGRLVNVRSREWNIVHNVMSIYLAVFMVALIYQYYRRKTAPYKEPPPLPKSSYDRINEMINRPPRY